MKNKLFASVPNILFGALITIAPQTFAHACTGHDIIITKQYIFHNLTRVPVTGSIEEFTYRFCKGGTDVRIKTRNIILNS